MNFYELLGITQTATQDEIHAAYLQLARKHHPDLQGGAESEEFRAIKHAHDVLMNPDSRCVYDESGLDPDDAGNKVELQAIALLRDFTIQILNDQQEGINILQHLINMLFRQQRQYEGEIRRVEVNIEKIEKSRAAIEAKWDGADRVKKVLLMMLDGAAEAQRTQKAGIQNQLGPVNRASELLKGATWKWDGMTIRARVPASLGYYGERDGSFFTPFPFEGIKP